MHKKGQVSIYMILGVVILAIGFIAILIWMMGFVSNNTLISFSRNAVTSYVSDCIEFELDEGLYTLGVRGGYIQPQFFMKVPTADSSFTSGLLQRDINYVPRIESVQSDLSKYIEDHIGTCLQDFQPFVERGMDISFGDAEAETSVYDDSIMVDLKFPLTVTKKDAELTFDKFNFMKTDIRLPYILGLADEIVTFSKSEARSFDLTELNGYQLDTTITPLNESLFLVLLTDSGSSVRELPYNFRFAMRY